jgi:hypothetical protein
MQVHLLVHLLGHRIAVQMMFEQRQGYDQRQQPLSIVLDEAQHRHLMPRAGRRDAGHGPPCNYPEHLTSLAIHSATRLASSEWLGNLLGSAIKRSTIR